MALVFDLNPLSNYCCLHLSLQTYCAAWSNYIKPCGCTGRPKGGGNWIGLIILSNVSFISVIQLFSCTPCFYWAFSAARLSSEWWNQTVVGVTLRFLGSVICSFLLCSPAQCDHGERGSVQGAGVLSSSQTSEHQESGQMVPHLEGQAQVINKPLVMGKS